MLSNADAPSIPAPNSIEWRQIGNTIDCDVDEDCRHLVEISHDGTRVVMASPSYGRQTKVKILEFNGNKWNEMEIFSKEDDIGTGCSVSLSGDGKTLAIWFGDDQPGHGFVEVYKYTEVAGWKSMRCKLKGTEYFGEVIALSADGSRIAIADRCSWGETGYVQIFQFDEDRSKTLMEIFGQVVKGSADWCTLVSEFEREWKPVGQTIVGEAPDDRLGKAISMSSDGSIVAIGTPQRYDDCGYVQVFQLAQGQERWRQIGQTLSGASGSHFGRSRSLSINVEGDIIAVGTLLNHVDVFHFQDGAWCSMLRSRLGGYEFDSVSLAPNSRRIAVSYDGEEGHVYIYDYIENDWVQVGDIAAPSSEYIYDNRPVSFSSCGKRVAITSVFGDTYIGSVKVYQIS